MQYNEILRTGKDSIERYMNKVVSIIVTYREIPIKGRMINTSRDFIELQRLGGDISMIRLPALLGISEGRDARAVV